MSSAIRPLLGRPSLIESLGMGLGSFETANSTPESTVSQLMPELPCSCVDQGTCSLPVCTSSARLIRLHVMTAAPRSLLNWRDAAAADLLMGNTMFAAAMHAASGRTTRCCFWHPSSLNCCFNMLQRQQPFKPEGKDTCSHCT